MPLSGWRTELRVNAVMQNGHPPLSGMKLNANLLVRYNLRTQFQLAQLGLRLCSPPMLAMVRELAAWLKQKGFIQIKKSVAADTVNQASPWLEF